jgi:hypothetical protein
LTLTRTSCPERKDRTSTTGCRRISGLPRPSVGNRNFLYTGQLFHIPLPLLPFTLSRTNVRSFQCSRHVLTKCATLTAGAPAATATALACGALSFRRSSSTSSSSIRWTIGAGRRLDSIFVCERHLPTLRLRLNFIRYHRRLHVQVGLQVLSNIAVPVLTVVSQLHQFRILRSTALPPRLTQRRVSRSTIHCAGLLHSRHRRLFLFFRPSNCARV